MGSLLVLIDGAGFVWRAHHAMPERRSPNGIPIHGVEGLVRMVLHPLWRKNRATHAAVVFEPGGKTIRHTWLDSYKAHRPPPPAELVAQLPLAKTACSAYGLPPIDVAGYEADDVLATLALRGVEAGMSVVVTTQDKDLLQLVRPNLRVYDQKNRRLWDTKAVEDRFGIPAPRVADWLALCGDSADGIPGLRGVGPKTATALLQLGGSVEGLLDQPGLVGQRAIREQLEQRAEELRLFLKLTTLITNVPVPYPLEALRRPETIEPTEFLQQHGLPMRLAYGF